MCLKWLLNGLKHILATFFFKTFLIRLSGKYDQKGLAIFPKWVLTSPSPSPSPKTKPQIQKGKGEFGLWAVSEILWVSVIDCCLIMISPSAHSVWQEKWKYEEYTQILCAFLVFWGIHSYIRECSSELKSGMDEWREDGQREHKCTFWAPFGAKFC